MFMSVRYGDGLGFLLLLPIMLQLSNTATYMITTILSTAIHHIYDITIGYTALDLTSHI
jgi:hypothetical protein